MYTWESWEIICWLRLPPRAHVMYEVELHGCLKPGRSVQVGWRASDFSRKNLRYVSMPRQSGSDYGIFLYVPGRRAALESQWWTTARKRNFCVYIAITGMYVPCVWSLIARKWYLFRWPGARKFSSSGRTGAVRVKWNRRRWYLVSGVFGLVFLSCWYNKSMLSENIWWGRYTGDSVGALNIGAAVVAPTRQLKLRY